MDGLFTLTCVGILERKQDPATSDPTFDEFHEAEDFSRQTEPLVMNALRKMRRRGLPTSIGFDPPTFNHTKWIREAGTPFDWARGVSKLTLHLPERCFQLRVWIILSFAPIHCRDGPLSMLPVYRPIRVHHAPLSATRRLQAFQYHPLLRKSVPLLLFGRTEWSNPI